MEQVVWLLDCGSLLYVRYGGFYFSCSLVRILAFQVGCLRLPSTLSSSPGVFTAITSVTALSSQQLEAHNRCIDFLPGQKIAIVDNCANVHVWNKCHHFVTFRPLQDKAQIVSTIGGKRHFPVDVSDVAVSWRDDNNTVFWHTLKDV